MTARQEFSKPYIAPPDIPPERLNILRTAFDATIRDPGFIEEAKEANLTIKGPMTGAELAAMTLELAQTPSSVAARISNIFRTFQAGG